MHPLPLSMLHTNYAFPLFLVERASINATCKFDFTYYVSFASVCVMHQLCMDALFLDECPQLMEGFKTLQGVFQVTSGGPSV